MNPTKREELEKKILEIVSDVRPNYFELDKPIVKPRINKKMLNALHRLMLKERRDELLILPRNKLADHINEVGERQDIAIVNCKFIENRIATLTSQIEGSKFDE